MRPVRTSALGFTLIEMMVVIAVAGILIGLAAVGLRPMVVRATVSSAAQELNSSFQLARSRAQATNSDVWLIIFPALNTATPNAEVAGPDAAYFLYEDRDGDFGGGAGSAYASFTHTPAIPSAPDRLLSSVRFTEKYAASAGQTARVAFGTLPNTSNLPVPPWPTSINDGSLDKACSFCSGNPRKGALVFKPDGSIRIVDGDGNDVLTGVGRLALRGSDTARRDIKFAIGGPTGLISMH